MYDISGHVEDVGSDVGQGQDTLHVAGLGLHNDEPPHARHAQPLHHMPALRVLLEMLVHQKFGHCLNTPPKPLLS